MPIVRAALDEEVVTMASQTDAIAGPIAAQNGPPRVIHAIKRLQEEQHSLHASSTKKQRLEEVTAIAKEVMVKHLATDLSYEVNDVEWEKLVQLTQQHPNFEKFFSFPNANAPGWVTPKKKKKPSHLKIVAIDCEMCITASLVTNETMSGALCRVSAIDGEDIIRNVVSDLIVHQPEEGYRLVDTKTDIHGITPTMIQQSKITVAKAQKKMLKYINSDTIVVGHSVHGDLGSLRINHRRVIDTALIYQRKGTSGARSTPGLRCLTKFLLNFEMPDGHDSTIDAQATMLAAKFAARGPVGAIIPSATELHGPRELSVHRSRLQSKQETYTGPPKLIPTAFQLAQAALQPAVNAETFINTSKIKEVTVAAAQTTEEPEDNSSASAEQPTIVPVVTSNIMTEAAIARSCRLRVHRIPKGVTSLDIENFFVQNTKIVPSAVEKIVWLPTQNRGSCNVTFATNAHASLAFESVQGPGKAAKVSLDAVGRMQKTISVVTSKGKTYKNIRLGVV